MIYFVIVTTLMCWYLFAELLAYRSKFDIAYLCMAVWGVVLVVAHYGGV